MTRDMVLVPGELYRLGSDDHYAEERPARIVKVAPFWIDRTPVTKAQFAAFVDATGYLTQAERSDPTGAAVFEMTAGPVDLRDPTRWWRFVRGAAWRTPEGEGSSIRDRMDHPVTHVTLEDARAYARWAGVRLPREAEWEAAALGAEAFRPDGTQQATVWRGAFPWYFDGDGAPGTRSVVSHPPSPRGLFDLLGNVWEWTDSAFDGRGGGCCGQGGGAGRQTAKGGSFLCAAEYCARYRPSARIGLDPASATAHLGFRCARDVE